MAEPRSVKLGLPPSQATMRPSTLIGGTSLINSIGDFLLVSCCLFLSINEFKNLGASQTFIIDKNYQKQVRTRRSN